MPSTTHVSAPNITALAWRTKRPEASGSVHLHFLLSSFLFLTNEISFFLSFLTTIVFTWRELLTSFIRMNRAYILKVHTPGQVGDKKIFWNLCAQSFFRARVTYAYVNRTLSSTKATAMIARTLTLQSQSSDVTFLL